MPIDIDGSLGTTMGMPPGSYHPMPKPGEKLGDPRVGPSASAAGSSMSFSQMMPIERREKTEPDEDDFDYMVTAENKAVKRPIRERRLLLASEFASFVDRSARENATCSH